MIYGGHEMFSGINLQEVCNLIILISAVIIAGKNIYGFLKKPVDDLQDRASDAEEKHIEEVLKREVPGLLQSNCKVIIGAIDELKEMTLEQQGILDEIQTSIDLLNVSQLDLLRYNMNRLYYKYRPYKKILDCDKKAFIKLYNDYHNAGGNTWIDSLYDEVKNWEIVEDENELQS